MRTPSGRWRRSKEGGDAFEIVADTALDADCQRAVERDHRPLGQLDILVNNVGTGRGPVDPGPFHVVDQDVKLAVAGDGLLDARWQSASSAVSATILITSPPLLLDRRQRPLGVLVLDVEHGHTDTLTREVLAGGIPMA